MIADIIEGNGENIDIAYIVEIIAEYGGIG
jgi:hypothetical protein